MFSVSVCQRVVLFALVSLTGSLSEQDVQHAGRPEIQEHPAHHSHVPRVVVSGRSFVAPLQQKVFINDVQMTSCQDGDKRRVFRIVPEHVQPERRPLHELLPVGGRGGAGLRGFHLAAEDVSQESPPVLVPRHRRRSSPPHPVHPQQ